MKRRVFGAGLAGVVASSFLAGCSTAEVSAPAEMSPGAVGPTRADRSVDAAAYIVPMSIAEWMEFAPTVVTGVVVSVGAPEYVREESSNGERPFEAVYSTVAMDVVDVLRGSYAGADRLNLRFLGGEADGTTFALEGAPSLSALSVGARIAVIAGDVSGQKTFTPTIVMVDDGDGYRDITGTTTDGDMRFDQEELVEFVRR